MATNNFKLISSSSISPTSDTVVNTAAAATTIVIHSVYVTNVGDSVTYANVKVVDSSTATTTHISYKTPISSGDTLILDKPINLEAGDSIRVRGANLEVTVSALEIS